MRWSPPVKNRSQTSPLFSQNLLCEKSTFPTEYGIKRLDCDRTRRPRNAATVIPTHFPPRVTPATDAEATYDPKERILKHPHLGSEIRPNHRSNLRSERADIETPIILSAGLALHQEATYDPKERILKQIIFGKKIATAILKQPTIRKSGY